MPLARASAQIKRRVWLGVVLSFSIIVEKKGVQCLRKRGKIVETVKPLCHGLDLGPRLARSPDCGMMHEDDWGRVRILSWTVGKTQLRETMSYDRRRQCNSKAGNFGP
jgi:hypothetical protein